MKKEKVKLGLYVHIPFCRSKCSYCDFYSVTDSEARVDEYVQALTTHLTEVSPQAAQYEVDSVYFGGGTPTSIGAQPLKTLLQCIVKRFDVSKDAEVTVEANPESACDLKELRKLRSAGFNRISIGMQSAFDKELKGVGRIHTFEQVRQAVDTSRRAKFKNVSLDLIFGLPRQTYDTFQSSLRAAIALEPEHISCYSLKVEEGTPLYRMRNTVKMANNDLQATMYLDAVSYLRNKGYAQYEISNFSKEGYESRHNMKYWRLGEYAGFGPGAHSDFGGVRYSIARDLDAYIAAMLHGGTLPVESERLPGWARDTEYIMLTLRTVRGIVPAEYSHTFRQRFDVFLPFLRRCESEELAECGADGSWHLTPKGFLVSNQIIGELLELLAAEKKRRAEAAARGDFRIVH